MSAGRIAKTAILPADKGGGVTFDLPEEWPDGAKAAGPGYAEQL